MNSAVLPWLLLVAAPLLLAQTFSPAVVFDATKYYSASSGLFSCGMRVSLDHTVRLLAMGVGTRNTLRNNAALVTNVNISVRSGTCGSLVATANIAASTTSPVSPSGGGYIWKPITGAQICISGAVTVYARGNWQQPDGVQTVFNTQPTPPITATYTGLTFQKALLSTSAQDCPSLNQNYWCSNLALADCPTTTDDAFTFTQGVFVVASPGVLQNDITSGAVALALTTRPSSGTVTLQNDGSFTYSPTGAIPQTDQFSYTITDSTGVGCPGTVKLLFNRQPIANSDTISKVSTAVGATSATFSVSVLTNDTDPDNDALTAVLATQASHGQVTLQPSGTFAFTWDQTFTGTDSFSYMATDGNLQSSAAVVTFSINRPPIAADDIVPKATAVVGQTSVSFGFNVLSNDVDIDAGDKAKLTASLVTNTQHGTVLLQPTGTFSFTWDETFTGTDSFTYFASDGSASSNTASVTFSGVDRPPVASSDTVPMLMSHGATSASFSYNVLSNDRDPDPADQLTAVLLTQPAHGHVDLSATGAGFTFSSWDSSFTGADSFSYVVTDSQGAQSNSATVMFSINLPPVAADDVTPMVTVVSTATSASFSPFSVLSNDRDPDSTGVLTATLVKDAKYGKVALQSMGTFTFSGWNSTFTGTDTFTYVTSDGYLQSNTATVTVNVLLNHRPSDADDSYTLTNNAKGTVLQVPKPGVLANDADPDLPKQTLSAVPFTGVVTTFGTATLNADGSFTYTNAVDLPMASQDSFSYVITDGTENSYIATVTINSFTCSRWHRSSSLPTAEHDEKV
eukprot:TRINITY_DN92_c0_g1_i3.p1 TRINITY_DN92_c0_g1~~TRINITY_DN92_c0_g1_i3.p1  ORF type:complete len:796 (-),score=162.50 TRINITY_DN92_c0_g1_i3:109-2496(-)